MESTQDLNHELKQAQQEVNDAKRLVDQDTVQQDQLKQTHEDLKKQLAELQAKLKKNDDTSQQLAQKIKQDNDDLSKKRQHLNTIQKQWQEWQHQRSEKLAGWLLDKYPQLADWSLEQIQQLLQQQLPTKLKQTTPVKTKAKQDELEKDIDKGQDKTLADQERIYSAWQTNDPIDTPEEANNLQTYRSPFGNRNVAAEISQYVHNMKVQGRDFQGHKMPDEISIEERQPTNLEAEEDELEP